MELRCCAPTRLLGEGIIDLGSVWESSNHQVNQKWIQLSLPSTTESVGFIKVGVIIIYKGDVETLELECKMLKQSNEHTPQIAAILEQQKAHYQFTIYSAFSLCAPDRRNAKPFNTFVKVTYCGLAGKTAVRHHDNNPVYNEEISMVEMFPNTNSTVCFEVCTHDGVTTKILGSAHLNMGWISHDGENGFLPTFGPSLLHMYGTLCLQQAEGPYNRGAILVSLKTTVPYNKQKVRAVNVKPVSPLLIDKLWVWEGFCIYCPVLDVSVIDSQFEGQCGVSITIGEMFNKYGEEKDDEGEFNAMLNEIRARRLNVLECELSKTDSCKSIDFSKGYHVLQLAARLPDFRFRIYRNNIVRRIVNGLGAAMEFVEEQINNDKSVYNDLIDILRKAVNEADSGMLYFLKSIDSEEPMGQNTDFDDKLLALQMQEIGNLRNKLSDRSSDNVLYSIKSNSVLTKKYVKMAVEEVKKIVDRLTALVNKNPHGWPDIIVWVCIGGVRVAYHRISPGDILFSSDYEQNGRLTGSMQTLYLKPFKCAKHQNSAACYCIIAKIELQFWMGLYIQYLAFEDSLPPGYKIKLKGYNIFLKANPMILECRVFIYSAKLRVGDTNPKTNVFARVHILDNVCETLYHLKSSLLTWNQVLKVRLETYTTQNKVSISPPELTVDVVESSTQGKECLVGRVNIRPTVDDRQSYEYAPKLRIFELYLCTEHVGEILMSAQLLQVPEKLLKTTSYTTSAEIREYANLNRDSKICSNLNEVEALPQSLLPHTKSYKIDIKWWGLRDLSVTKKPCVILEINNLTVKSNVLDKKENCNFPHEQSSYNFEAPLSESYCPPLSFRLYDCSTFGRTVFLGANVVKNPSKFLVKCISVTERERQLKGKRIKTSTFHQGFYYLVPNIEIEMSIFRKTAHKNQFKNVDV
ncbi:fer-1-like protein 6 [Amyelois transitella]|uniref:fer-1-like protein 6 n=1 Tax=Amyelois transitella TaxID=680683 RepID=UPI00298F5A7C|nr:fer-1-like protein 6 [Amyelois transitella]